MAIQWMMTTLIVMMTMILQPIGAWTISKKPIGFTKKFHAGVACQLNRLLFDESEFCQNNMQERSVILPVGDFRTIHVAKILGLKNGDTIRCGVVSNQQHGGFITDEATIQWIPEGKVKKAEPLGNGLPPGSLQIFLTNLVSADEVIARPSVSLILALPRPLALGRMLPMISQMGVDTLVLTESKKVPKDYFGSHLFRNNLLIEGLCQSGDVRLPKIIVARNLSKFLEAELNNVFPTNDYARVIAHPQRMNEPIIKLRDVSFPITEHPRMVIAVGPEGGWEEPDELDKFVQNYGFVQVCLGGRVLRSDCAVVSLLALGHDICS
jgi:RsmE family RNA methyltransferase